MTLFFLQNNVRVNFEPWLFDSQYYALEYRPSFDSSSIVTFLSFMDGINL